MVAVDDEDGQCLHQHPRTGCDIGCQHDLAVGSQQTVEQPAENDEVGDEDVEDADADDVEPEEQEDFGGGVGGDADADAEDGPAIEKKVCASIVLVARWLEQKLFFFYQHRHSTNF